MNKANLKLSKRHIVIVTSIGIFFLILLVSPATFSENSQGEKFFQEIGSILGEKQINQPGSDDEIEKYYNVLSIIDGDTIKIETIGTLRLIGIDTPETKDPRKPVECFGNEASAKAKDLLEGQKVRIEFDDSQGRLDKYGRVLVYVYREDGLLFNKEMISQGFAFEYTYNKPYMYQQDFKKAQDDAKRSNLGLWSQTTCNGDR